jgi:hypothetical protein
MATTKKAFVVVDQEWFDKALYMFISDKRSASTNGAHLITGPVEDLSDHRGIWLSDVESRVRNSNDDSPVPPMRLMIPWQFVLAVGVVEGAETKLPAGFQNVTDLTKRASA